MTKLKILVVEDEGIIAEDLKSSLMKMGYEVPAVVSSGEDAVKSVKEIRPDLVLMDIFLKGMDGITAAGKISSGFNIPVIYLTAYADRETLERAKITEPFGYIVKPFEDKELHSAIEIALFKHKMEKKLRESEEWLSTTLKSIDSAVITTDTEGRVVLMNPVAEALTGYMQEEARGKKIEDVFKVVNEETEVGVEDPVKKVLRDGFVVGLANHTLLINRKGKKIPIDDSGAPISDRNGDQMGAVLAFRNITSRRLAEKALKESEEKYRGLYNELRQLLISTVSSLTSAIDMKSHWTSGHSERVTEYAIVIGKTLGLDEKSIETLRLGSILHDIGKIGTYDVILDKPDKLTAGEFELIKNHPVKGASILEPIKQMKEIISIVKHHHERIDGKGYPDGLKGEDIPLFARILHVADAYDSMTSDRPYRKSPGWAYAVSELKRHSGTQFDEGAVRAFLASISRIWQPSPSYNYFLP